VSHLDQIAVRLREISQQLADPSIEDERAEQLAREAGELAAEAGSEVDRRLSEAASGETPPAPAGDDDA
jgi:hypothetical protein